MDELSLCQMVHDVIDNNIYLAFKDVKIFFHYVVIMRSEILSRLELHYRKIHSGAFHQILRPVILKTILFIFFINYKHIMLLLFLFSGNARRSPHVLRDAAIAQIELGIVYIPPYFIHFHVFFMMLHIRL